MGEHAAKISPAAFVIVAIDVAELGPASTSAKMAPTTASLVVLTFTAIRAKHVRQCLRPRAVKGKR